MKYSIIIPTYNHCDDLLKPCIQAILKFTEMSEVELVISANGCNDNTEQYLNDLKYQFESLGFGHHIQTVWHNEPIGYSRATNAGIEIAKGKYLILLNNDAFLLPQPRHNWIRMLEQPFKDVDNCGISCLVKHLSEPAGHDFAIFFCVMIDKIVFDKLGLLNEEYGKGGGEDTEFCIEAERLGFQVCECTPKKFSDEANTNIGSFPMYHKGEGTVHDKSLVPDYTDVFFRNSLKLAKKYNPDWYYAHANNIAVDHQNLKNQNPFVYNKIFESNLYSVMPEEITNKVVIDIGANIGIFSILCNELNAHHIYAIEAQPKIYRRKLVDNTISFPKITTLNFAVSNDFGSTLYMSDQDDWSKISTDGDSVQSITLEKLLVDNRIDNNNMVLKIDCEGSEFDILLSTRADVLQRFAIIYMEIHKDANQDPELIRDKLLSSGFKQLNSIQMYGYPPEGEPIPMGNFIEKWSRI